MANKITQANVELHVHPFLGRNTLADVIEAMDRTKLDIVALESLDSPLYPYLVQEARNLHPTMTSDSAGIRLPNGKYILNAGEYDSSEGFHVLTVGYSSDKTTPLPEIRRIIDKGLSNGALILLDHPFVDNKKTKTAGHISEELEKQLEKLCIEYPDQIALEWNGYCIPWMRSVLKLGLNAAGLNIHYHDVNKRAEELSEKLKVKGYNIPVLADTDVHARTKKHLLVMGTSRFITDVEGESASDILQSMKKNIFGGNYQNIKNYVSMLHLLRAFCLPILFPKSFDKPRA